MGSASSTEQVSSEQHEIESIAASTGALPMLHKAFSTLADPQTNQISPDSLQQCLCFNFNNLIYEAQPIPEYFPALLKHLGSSIADQFVVDTNGGIDWIEFVRGYVMCCGRMPLSAALNVLLRVFSLTFHKADLPLNLQVESNDPDDKISGSFLSNDVLMLLWMCYIMFWTSTISNNLKEKVDLCHPNNISPLVLSAIVSCTEGGHGLDVWGCDISTLKDHLPAGKFHMWVKTTVPSLPNCFTQFVHTSLQNCVTTEQDKADPSSSSTVGVSPGDTSNCHLLTHGTAWAISLSMRNSSLNEEVLRACFPNNPDEIDDTLLYRSSVHGKGMNRFCSNVEGYKSPLLILVSASSGDDQRWIIGAITQQGLENRDVFYGSSGNLYAISPVFHSFSPSGREKNFVYSHLRPTSRVYEANPKPVGIAFGGSLGNERVFIDEDFAKVTVRHHAVDKTYEHGPLIPNQGFLPVEASILEVEVWGLGGDAAKHTQTSYKNREQLFTEQRRKIDLNTFTNWEDSPEKMMMDMMGNPNKVQREER